MVSFDDADLVRQIQAGHQQAFRMLMVRHRKRVYQVAFNIVRNHLDADEVVQETFVRVYNRRNDLLQVATVSSFLIRIASNYAIDLIRKRRGHVSLEQETGEYLEHEIAREKPVPLPGLDLERAELRAEILKAMDDLPPRQRLTVYLHDVEGLTKAEVATAMDCPEATVRSNLHLARAKLRDVLKSWRTR